MSEERTPKAHPRAGSRGGGRALGGGLPGAACAALAHRKENLVCLASAGYCCCRLQEHMLAPGSCWVVLAEQALQRMLLEWT